LLANVTPASCPARRGSKRSQQTFGIWVVTSIAVRAHRVVTGVEFFPEVNDE
jgi:hypothetical protein